MKEKTGYGTAIGKIILMGEHAVVYGEPAIAIPFSAARIKTNIIEGKGSVILDCDLYKGSLFNAPKRLFGLVYIIRKITEDFGEELKDFNINIESNIPLERGMGSSAAVSVATIRALYEYFGKNLAKSNLIKLTNISEKINHGNPSGIDSAVIIGEASIYYLKKAPPMALGINLDSYLIVADTGIPGQTKEAVKSVKRLILSNPQRGKSLIKGLGILAKETKEILKVKDSVALGRLMTEAHQILDELEVSNDTLNHLVNVARESGALGAKLTGGGLGGCIIALASTKEEAQFISDRLLANGANNTWISYMGVDKI